MLFTRLLSSFNPNYIKILSVPKQQSNFFIRKQLLTMDSNNLKTTIGVIQLTSKENKDDNFEIAKNLIKSATNDGAKMVFLPECFDMICPSKKLTIENGEPIDGPTVQRYQELAKNLKIWISLGGLHEKDPQSDDKRLFNAHLILNDNGDIVSIYRKVHLFNLDIPGTRLVESEFSQPGSAVIKPVQTPCGKLGQGICYDVRFAEFAISLAKAGADILSYPSSFTIPTGKAHWEILLRSRAIETQCYVVAAAQAGTHNPKRSSYGHSMIIDPWGTILAQISEDKPGYATALIDFEHLGKMRQRLPIWTDRRPELYGFIVPAQQESSSNNKNLIDDQETFKFGETAIVKSYQIFAKTLHSIAFINHRPVLPGHVLVSPLKSNLKRLADLNNEQLFDLFNLVQKVQKCIETINETKSSTVAIQDGKDAGQSIEHLHVHIVPRKITDFGGNIDSIYEKLNKHDKNDPAFKLLTEQQMQEQCNILRKFFS